MPLKRFTEPEVADNCYTDERLPDATGLVRNAVKHRSEAEPKAAGTAVD